MPYMLSEVDSSHGMATDTVAVIVAYHPDLNTLGLQLDSLLKQLAHVVIVDNGSSESLEAWLSKFKRELVSFVKFGGNKGIAVAHNAGIQVARERSAKFVLLMDHDSVPAFDMVQNLMDAVLQNPNAAAVGPRYVDIRQDNPPPFIRIENFRLVRCNCDRDDAVIPVDYLISSGCLIPLAVLDEVGGMREDLFIDYVDIEWGLRARRFGYQSFGVCSAHMEHSLGEKPIKFFGKAIPVHSPLRHYYHFRNAVILYKDSNYPANWKVVDGWKLLQKYFFYSLFTEPRFNHFKMMSLGILHGFMGKTGRL